MCKNAPVSMMKLPYLLILSAAFAAAQSQLDAQPGSQWKFALSGDSRNCGDIVMPAIAKGVRASGAEFYWHLGDYRAIYTFDEDIVPPPSLGLPPKPITIAQYTATAWPDFIAHQLVPFGDLPVFLAPGNHEFIPPMTRADYLTQFADWFETPVIREQRLKDNSQNHMVHLYYHWIKGNVDFISLDNASYDQFDGNQLAWIRTRIEEDEKSDQIRTIILGMHEALPASSSDAHSMSESGTGERSGRQVYEMLLHAQNVSHKHVYVFASHSHFYMEDVYHTDTWKGKVLPGWIVGTAGAQRYVLPAGVEPGSKAMTNVYGYLVVTVRVDGTITTSFERLSLDDLLKSSPAFPEPLVRWCYEENHQ